MTGLVNQGSIYHPAIGNVTGKIRTFNGVYNDSDRTFPPASNDIMVVGDSTAVNLCGGPALSTNAITVKNGVLTWDRGTTTDTYVGMTFTIYDTDDTNLNLRLCTVTNVRTRNKFDFTASGYSPPDGQITNTVVSAGSGAGLLWHNYMSIQAYPFWLNSLMGGPFNFSYIMGRTGYKVSDIYSIFFDRIKSFSGGWVWFCLGINGFSTVDQFGTPSQIYSQYLEMIDYVVSSGKIAICNTTTPNAGGLTIGDNRLYKVQWFNQKVRNLEAIYNGRVFVCDWEKWLVDPASTTGAALAAYSSDGTHQSPAGAIKIAKEMRDKLKGLLPGTLQNSALQCPKHPSSQGASWANASTQGGAAYATQLLSNTGLQGTGGTSGAGITGTTPTGWTTDCLGTATATLTTSANATGNGNKVAAVCAFTATGDTVRLYQSIASALQLLGRKIRVGATVKVTSATLPKEISIRFEQALTGSESGSITPFLQMPYDNQNNSANSYGNALNGETLTFISNEFICQNHTAGVMGYMFMYAIGYAGGAISLEWSEPFVILVD